MYAFIENNTIVKYPITVDDLRKKYPLISFPSNFNDFDYSEYNVISYVETQFPEYNPEIERIVESTPIFEENIWKQNWITEPLSDDELQRIISDKILSIRSNRNRLLLESDWTQFNDSPLDKQSKTAWLHYRQELRDITSQNKFPYEVIWPKKPQLDKN
tara:strand:+ start:304 stop:780 length:477 start_codon:yes stop_codon:yes gene_type:complete